MSATLAWVWVPQTEFFCCEVDRGGLFLILICQMAQNAEALVSWLCDIVYGVAFSIFDFHRCGDHY
jgi:hypothetical protein